MIDMKINGEYFQLPARDMDVSMPLASGMSILATGDNFVVMTPSGGTIKNKPTGKENPLYGKTGSVFLQSQDLASEYRTAKY